MSQDQILVTAALAGTLEVMVQKWLAPAAGNFPGESKWLWAWGTRKPSLGRGTLFIGLLWYSLFLSKSYLGSSRQEWARWLHAAFSWHLPLPHFILIW